MSRNGSGAAPAVPSAVPGASTPATPTFTSADSAAPFFDPNVPWSPQQLASRAAIADAIAANNAKADAAAGTALSPLEWRNKVRGMSWQEVFGWDANGDPLQGSESQTGGGSGTAAGETDGAAGGPLAHLSRDSNGAAPAVPGAAPPATAESLPPGTPTTTAGETVSTPAFFV